MRVFRQLLSKLNTSPDFRKWLFVPYDQLNDNIGPLATENPKNLGLVMVENSWKAELRPYHKQKLALIICNMRHFALEQAARGVSIRYLVSNDNYRNALEPIAKEVGQLTMMRPAEWELRKDLEPLVHFGLLKMIKHEGWLTCSALPKLTKKPSPIWRMDAFYREARRCSGVLMRDGKPLGAKFSHDAANRLMWRGKPAAPHRLSFPLDEIKLEVGRLIEKRFSHHPGHLDMSHLPGTKFDAESLWNWSKEQCLQWFGPYEDAMSSEFSGLFHTRISSLLNIHRLIPLRIIAEAESLQIPLQSKEGFIRQILGWREFVHQIHEVTEGFRHFPDPNSETLPFPGDGGYAHWAGSAWPGHKSESSGFGGACPNWFGADSPLPPAFWGLRSGLHCLDTVISNVWEEGYSHHITRLMILCNIASLLDVKPRELADWFWAAYTDAFDWVVEPNVLGMGTYAVGDLMTTKPYIAGANYINKMSDFCHGCQFDPKKNCPLKCLYWAFAARHQSRLQNNARLKILNKAITNRDSAAKLKDEAIYRKTKSRLLNGETLTTRYLEI